MFKFGFGELGWSWFWSFGGVLGRWLVFVFTHGPSLVKLKVGSLFVGPHKIWAWIREALVLFSKFFCLVKSQKMW